MVGAVQNVQPIIENIEIIQNRFQQKKKTSCCIYTEKRRFIERALFFYDIISIGISYKMNDFNLRGVH